MRVTILNSVHTAEVGARYMDIFKGREFQQMTCKNSMAEKKKGGGIICVEVIKERILRRSR